MRLVPGWLIAVFVIMVVFGMTMCSESQAGEKPSANPAKVRVVYNAPSGCIWRKTHGFCMVSNTLEFPVECKVKVRVRTLTTDTMREYKVTVQPGKMDDSYKLFTEKEDEFKDMSVEQAHCRAA